MRITRVDISERIHILDEYNWDLENLIDKIIELQTENDVLQDKIWGLENRIAEFEKE